MTAGSGESLPSKRDYNAYSSGNLPGDANPPRDANGSADKAANDVADTNDNSIAYDALGIMHGLEGRPKGTGAESSQGPGHAMDRAGAEHPGMDRLPPPAEPPVRIREAVSGSNGRSSDNAATVSIPGCEGVATFNLEEKRIRSIIGNNRATISPPPGLAAPGVTSNGRSNSRSNSRRRYSARIGLFNRYGALTTTRNHNNTNQSTTTSSSNRVAIMSNRAAPTMSNSRIIYQQLSDACKAVTHAQMDEPVEGPVGVQFDELIGILREQKTSNIALYRATNNQLILQLEWAAPEKRFNRACAWGDWVVSAKLNNMSRDPPQRPAELHRTFIDIEIKRIAGDDQETMLACGVHPQFAFMGLLGYKPTSGNNPADGTASNRSSSSSASTITAMTSASPGAWPSERALIAAQAAPSTSIPAASATEAALPSTPGAWPADSAKNPSAAASPSSSTTVSPATPAILTISARPPGNRRGDRPIITALQRAANEAARARLYSLIEAGPSFEEAKANSAIYLVRVIAMPGPTEWSSTQTNALGGPTFRRATLCGLGGWVVPDASACRGTLPEHALKMTARDLIRDWTFNAPVATEGDYVPVWEGAEEPKMEDVYRMVWDLVAGRDFIGLVPGHGFGRRRDGGFAFGQLRGQNPF